MAKTHITVLVENTARGPGLLAEHGLAYWIEHGGQQVLMDSGQGQVLVGNAFKLGIVLSQVDTLVLSHGHYDHTGVECVPRTVFTVSRGSEARV